MIQVQEYGETLELERLYPEFENPWLFIFVHCYIRLVPESLSARILTQPSLFLFLDQRILLWKQMAQNPIFYHKDLEMGFYF